MIEGLCPEVVLAVARKRAATLRYCEGNRGAHPLDH